MSTRRVGWADQHDARIVVDLPRQHDLLLMPPEKFAVRSSGARA